MRRATPYALTGLGLTVGLVVLLFEPLATATLNYFVGAAAIVIAVAAVTAMIVEYSGPGRRGPDF
ncbi:MAG: hypothetical protein ABEH56_07135 [Salinirussus sp.]